MFMCGGRVGFNIYRQACNALTNATVMDMGTYWGVFDVYFAGPKEEELS